MKKSTYQKISFQVNIPDFVYVKELYHNDQGLILHLIDPDSSFTFDLHFYRPLFYRYIDESDFLITLPNQRIPSGHSFFTVVESRLLAWFHKESGGKYMNSNVQHYAILTPDDCLDVISESPPAVENPLLRL